MVYKTSKSFVSISSTIVSRHSQIHQTYLVENLSNFNIVFHQKMASFVHTFISRASSTFAQTKANAYVYNQMLVQAKLMSYVDVFAVFALLAFLLIPITFFFKSNSTTNSRK